MAAPKGNKYAVGNNGGRPPFFNSKEELQSKIDEYFITGRGVKVMYSQFGQPYEVPVYTVCGLALFLGFSTRQGLDNYQNTDEYYDIIKRAKLRIEKIYEENLHFGQPTGSIFALKNMGWKDSQNIDHTTAGESFNVKPFKFRRSE